MARSASSAGEARPERLLGFADPLHADVDGGHLGPDLVLDLLRDLAVGLQEVARVLAALAKASVAVVEPGAGLRQHTGGDADVEQAALAADALVVHDVELGQPERRGDLVLDDLDAGPGADRIGAGLQRLDATDVQPHAGVELQGATAR